MFGVWCAVISWLIVVQASVVEEASDVVLPRFEGHITSEKGEVIEGAKIVITWTDSQNNPELDPSIPPNDRILGSATSGRDGSYAIRWNGPTIPGRREQEPRFYLTVLHPLWAPLQRGLLLDGSGDIRATIQMQPGVAYQSRVVDQDGQPVAGATVRLEGCYASVKRTSFLSKTDGVQLFMDLSETLIATSDEKGEFRFPCLPKSECVLLRVHHPAYESELRFRTTTGSVPQVPDMSNLIPGCKEMWNDLEDDIHLGVSRRERILVRERTSQLPIVGAEVAPYFSGMSAKTDEEGYVELPVGQRALMNGAYVRRTESEKWSLRSKMEKENNTLVLSLEALHAPIRIQGTVREAESKRGLAGVTVTYRSNMGYTTTNDEGQYEFIIPSSSTGEGFVSIAGPLEGWMLPFSRKTSDPKEPHLASDPNKHRKSFRLDTNVEGIDFEVEKMPETTILVLGVNGKPASRAKVIVSWGSVWTTKEVEADQDGKIKIGLLPDFRYWFYAQGHESGAALSWVVKLSTEKPITIQLLPSVEVYGNVWYEDHVEELFPAEGAYVDVTLPKQVQKQLGGRGYMRVARLNRDGDFSFLLPEMDVEPGIGWAIRGGGNQFEFDEPIYFNQNNDLRFTNVRSIFTNRNP